MQVTASDAATCRKMSCQPGSLTIESIAFHTFTVFTLSLVEGKNYHNEHFKVNEEPNRDGDAMSVCATPSLAPEPIKSVKLW